MSRWAATGVVFATVMALVGTDCARQCDIGPGGCPDATFNLRALDDSSVTWTLQGVARVTASRLTPAPPRTGECSFTFNKGRVDKFGTAGEATLYGGYFNLTCDVGDAGKFDLSISQLGDFRDWSPGTFTIFPDDLSFGIDFFGSGTTCTSAGYPGVRLTITVETATGSAAPYPKMVTADFVRTFRLDFDTTDIGPTKYGHTDACDFPLIVGPVSLHLTQTAADYNYDPTAPCACD
jgi:hypothetical protein